MKAIRIEIRSWEFEIQEPDAAEIPRVMHSQCRVFVYECIYSRSIIMMKSVLQYRVLVHQNTNLKFSTLE
jgi:hypothetical protein